MDIELSTAEVKVLGTVEKDLTTPDQYPVSKRTHQRL